MQYYTMYSLIIIILSSQFIWIPDWPDQTKFYCIQAINKRMCQLNLTMGWKIVYFLIGKN